MHDRKQVEDKQVRRTEVPTESVELSRAVYVMKALHGDELGEKLIHKDVKFIHTIRFTLSIYLASITVEGSHSPSRIDGSCTLYTVKKRVTALGRRSW